MAHPEMQLADVVLKVRNQFVDRRIAASIQRLSLPEIPETERLQLLQEQQELRAFKRRTLAPMS